MTIRIEIETENAAFESPNEVWRIMKDITDRIETGDIDARQPHNHPIRDVNGNQCGFMEVS
jgi:hypothetical protein